MASWYWCACFNLGKNLCLPLFFRLGLFTDSDQFGFDGGDIWKTRRDNLVNSLFSNPKAPYVTRVVQFGSEPLFDDVLTVNSLASQVKRLKGILAPLGIPVTVSDMA